MVTEYYIYLFLNDARDGIPYGYLLPSTLELSTSTKYLKKVFKGYVFTLQYLWFRLLGKKEFSKSCLKELHKASKIYSKEAEESIEWKLGIPLLKDIEETITKEQLSENQDFDNYSENLKKLYNERKNFYK